MEQSRIIELAIKQLESEINDNQKRIRRDRKNIYNSEFKLDEKTEIRYKMVLARLVKYTEDLKNELLILKLQA